ncbi:hypothetical protein XENOCAPTIV_022985, partial [Xenoophorus captivus]
MGCKTGVHPSVDTGPAGVVEVPYRSCSTHLPVPRCFHPFLWVLHTIHHDQLTTNMPSASMTGDTVPVIIKMDRVEEEVIPLLATDQSQTLGV